MNRREFGSLEVVVLLYVVCQVMNVGLTKLTTARLDSAAPGLGGGLAILPWSLATYGVLTGLFIWLSGWHRDAHAVRFAGLRLPRATRYTAISGLGSALMLSSVPMSFSLPDVSIPLILLLMRGGILLIAPLIDLAFGRRIRWWSGVALAMVVAALSLVLYQRGSLRLSMLATTTLLFYNVGFVLRLTVMTHIAKRGDPAQTRRYFVEEKLVALPLAIVALSILAAVGGGLAGVIGVEWTAPLIGSVLGMGLTLAIVSVLVAIILLDARENSFCVPLERSGGLLAGVAAAWLLHWGWDMPAPTGAEMIGAVILLGAILLLTLAPQAGRRAQERVLKPFAST